MIDSVVLRLHNLSKYAQLLQSFFAHGDKSQTTFTADQGTVDREKIKKDFILFNSSGAIHPKFSSTRIYIPSSSYFLNIYPALAFDYIEYNFSIPKYLVGHNIYQFVNYFDTSAEGTYKRLLSFIDDFRKSFSAQNMELQDLEIVQIDFCYNQFHNSKDDALNYLDAQLPIVDSYGRKNGKVPVKRFGEGDYSFHLPGKRYTMKLYHKGSEFAKNDYRKLLNRNIKFDLEKLRSISDEILRYEISYKLRYLNDCFHRLYCDCTDTKGKDSVYRYLFDDRNEVKKKRYTRSFRFKSNFDNWKKFKETFPDWENRLSLDRNVSFNFPIFKIMYDHFWKFFNKMQVTSISDTKNLVEKIESINEARKVRNALSSSPAKLKNLKMLSRYIETSKTENLKTMVKRRLLSPATYYRIMQEFRKIGLKEYNPGVGLIRPENGYREYKARFGKLH